MMWLGCMGRSRWRNGSGLCMRSARGMGGRFRSRGWRRYFGRAEPVEVGQSCGARSSSTSIRPDALEAVTNALVAREPIFVCQSDCIIIEACGADDDDLVGFPRSILILANVPDRTSQFFDVYS